MASRGNTTIAKMQLFHHLKQIYPEIPDEVVTETMNKFGKETVQCMDYLKKESHRYRYGHHTGQQCNHHGSVNEQSSLVQHPTAIPLTGGPPVPSYTYSRTSDAVSPAIYTSPPNATGVPAPAAPPSGVLMPGNQIRVSSSSVNPGGQYSAPVVSTPGDYFDMPRPHQRWYSGSEYTRSPVNHSNATASPNASRVNFQMCDMVNTETRYDPQRNEYYNVYNLQSQKGAHYHSPNLGSPPISTSAHSPQPRYKTQLNMDPVGPQATNFGIWEPPKYQDRLQQPQGAFTSVSLQLRAPGGGPNASQFGPSMNYSTSSRNSDQGYQSQVKVEIGPNGGSIQAVRRHLAAPGTPPPPTNASLSIHYRAGRIEGQPPSVSQRCTVNPRPSSWYMAGQRTADSESRGMERKSSLPDITRGLSFIDSEDPGQLKDSRVPIQPMMINPVKRTSLGDVEHSMSRRCSYEQSSFAVTQALLLEQKSRSEKMKKLLIRERDRLCCVRNECRKLKEELEERSHGRNANLPSFVQIQKLREDTRRLRLECERLTTEVDTHDVPLCETNLTFYKKLEEMESRSKTTTTSTTRTTRSRSVQERRTQGRHGREDRNNNPDREEEDPRWSCTVCTFLNHPALDKCEQCEMPRVVLEEDLRQNIHIQFSHHNFPSRVVHNLCVTGNTL